MIVERWNAAPLQEPGTFLITLYSFEQVDVILRHLDHASFHQMLLCGTDLPASIEVVALSRLSFIKPLLRQHVSRFARVLSLVFEHLVLPVLSKLDAILVETCRLLLVLRLKVAIIFHSALVDGRVKLHAERFDEVLCDARGVHLDDKAF